MIINLTDTQKKEIEKASAEFNLLNQRTALAKAHYQSVVTLICDAIGYEPDENTQYKNGQLFVKDKEAV